LSTFSVVRTEELVEGLARRIQWKESDCPSASSPVPVNGIDVTLSAAAGPEIDAVGTLFTRIVVLA
jgi:hypothetical protein